MGWLCVYLLASLIIRPVWRRVATEWTCLWSNQVNEDGNPLLPSHPRSPYPDKGKPLTGSDGARHLWGSPLLRSFYSPLSLFPFIRPVCRSTLCHLASAFGGRLHKSWTAFPAGKAREFNWKGDPEWKLPFLFRPLFCESTETYQGKEDEMYRGVSERNRSCP